MVSKNKRNTTTMTTEPQMTSRIDTFQNYLLHEPYETMHKMVETALKVRCTFIKGKLLLTDVKSVNE